jgi:hypothetical protein
MDGPEPLQTGEISVDETKFKAIEVMVGWLCTLSAMAVFNCVPLQSR